MADLRQQIIEVSADRDPDWSVKLAHLRSERTAVKASRAKLRSWLAQLRVPRS